MGFDFSSLSEDEAQKIISDYNAGKTSLVGISGTLQCGVQTVKRFLILNGVRIRGTHEATIVSRARFKGGNGMTF